MTIGSRIKELRKKYDLSQEQLAKKLNVSRQAVQKWEANINEPNIETIKTIKIYFNISYDYLLDGGEITVTNIDAEKKEVKDFKVKKKSFKERISSLPKLTKTFIISIILTIIALCALLIFMYAISPYGWHDEHGSIHHCLKGYWLGADSDKTVCAISVILGVLIIIDIVIIAILLVRYLRRKKGKCLEQYYAQ